MPPRPDQAQTRRDGTRARLLDAGVELLVERGLDGFTTPEVAGRAGLAQGTVFRHFPSKRDLLVATTEAALVACRDDHLAAFTTRVRDEQPADADGVIRIGLESLWASCIDRRTLAVAEVRARCRTDHALRDALRPVIGTENEISGDLIALLVPTAFHVPTDAYVAVSRIVLNTMHGRALAGLARPDAERDLAIVESLIALAQQTYRRDADAQRAPATPDSDSDSAPLLTRSGEGTVQS